MALIEIPVSLVTYAVAVMCFFGYFLLIIFGGIGLGALPLDLMMSYRLRPVFVICYFLTNYFRKALGRQLKKKPVSRYRLRT